jgi:hypothetical protein
VINSVTYQMLAAGLRPQENVTQWYVFIFDRWQCTVRPAYWLEHGYSVAMGEWWKEVA